MIHGDYCRTIDNPFYCRRGTLNSLIVPGFINDVVLINPTYGCLAAIFPFCCFKGAHDISNENLSFLYFTSLFISVRFAKPRREVQRHCLNILQNVRDQQNQDTHERIHNVNLLIAMLNKMKEFYVLLSQHSEIR